MSEPALPGAAVELPAEALQPAVAGEDALPGDAVAQAPVANAPQALPNAAVQPVQGPPLGNKVADVLLLYDSILTYKQQDPELLARLNLFAQHSLGGAVLESFYGWDDFARRLQAYQTIRELVIFIHGEAGQLEANILDQGDVVGQNKTLEQVIGLFHGAAPRVTDRVSFESCVVADNPSQMVPVKQLFGAARVTGWNYFHVLSARIPFTLVGGESAATIQGWLPYPDEYLLLGMPHPTTYAGQAGKYDILYEWFRDTEIPTPPGPNPDRRVHIPRGEATIFTLSSAQAACMGRLMDPTGIDLKTLCELNMKNPPFTDLAQVTIQD